MAKPWQDWNTKQRFFAFLLLVCPVILVVRYTDIPWPELATPGKIAELNTKLTKRRSQLKILKAERDVRGRVMAGLRNQAAPFWQIPGKPPNRQVPTEFQRLAQQAKVTPSTTGSPRVEQLLDLSHVKTVAFTVRLNKVTMREVSRLLGTLENAAFPFYWVNCKISPDNKKTPQLVTLTGQLKAYVLADKASRFLAAEGARP